MKKASLKPYSVRQFLDDTRREFHFLVEEHGFVESSSQWTSHNEFGFSEHVVTATPILTYEASMRRVTIAHDPRGALEVSVTSFFPNIRSASVEEMARDAGAPRPEQYGEIYDLTERTAADRLAKLAEGLRTHGATWVSEPESS